VTKTPAQLFEEVCQGEPCPHCEGTSYEIQQLVVSVQKSYDGEWSGSTYYDESPDVLSAMCVECGEYLFNRVTEVEAAIKAALAWEGEPRCPSS
jgi:hypothetical protein